MAIQREAWNKLKRNILQLNISHQYLLDLDIVPVPKEVLLTHQHLTGHEWDITINGNFPKTWINDLNRWIGDFKEEVNINQKLNIDKESLIQYFSEIQNSMRELHNGIIYHDNNQTFEFLFADFNDDLKENGIANHFMFKVQDIYIVFNKLINELSLFLGNIDIYKELQKKSLRSISGNKKIEWKKQVNQLVDFYLNQLADGFIETDRDNLKIFLMNNFTFNGTILSENTINTLFDPNKEIEKLPKAHKKVDPKRFIKG